MAVARKKTMVLFTQKSHFFALKPKTQCIGRIKVGFFPILLHTRWMSLHKHHKTEADKEDLATKAHRH